MLVTSEQGLRLVPHASVGACRVTHVGLVDAGVRATVTLSLVAPETDSGAQNAALSTA